MLDKYGYEKEYDLNTRPLEIDLLVIKKDSNIQKRWMNAGHVISQCL